MRWMNASMNAVPSDDDDLSRWAHFHPSKDFFERKYVTRAKSAELCEIPRNWGEISPKNPKRKSFHFPLPFLLLLPPTYSYVQSAPWLTAKWLGTRHQKRHTKTTRWKWWLNNKMFWLHPRFPWPLRDENHIIWMWFPPSSKVKERCDYLLFPAAKRRFGKSSLAWSFYHHYVLKF